MKNKWVSLVVILISAVMIFLVGCQSRQQTKEEVYKDFKDRLTKITSYTCTAKVEAIGNKTSTIYVFKHTYKKPDYYKLEVKSPQNISGKVMEYKGDKLLIHNPNIDDTVELPNMNNDCHYLFIGDFIKNYLENETAILKPTLNQLKIEIEMPGDNKYFNKQILYVNNKTKNPEKMEIIDYEGSPRFIVTYEDFQYEK